MNVVTSFALYYPKFGSGNLISQTELVKNTGEYAKKLHSENRYVGILTIQIEDARPLLIEDELDCAIRSLCIEGSSIISNDQEFTYSNFKNPEEINFTPTSGGIKIHGEDMLTENDEPFELLVPAHELVVSFLKCAEYFINMLKSIQEISGDTQDEVQKYEAELKTTKETISKMSGK